MLHIIQSYCSADGALYLGKPINLKQEGLMLDYIKDRLGERTSWDGATIIGVSLLIIVAAPIVKLLAWPALAYGIWTLVKPE